MSPSAKLHHASRSVAIHALLLSTLLLAPALPAWAATTTGEFKTAVVLVNFQDSTDQPITATAAYNLVFGSVSDFYWEASYQKTFLSGSVYGWFTMPLSRSDCDTTKIAAEADKAATAAGANLAAFSKVVYMFPGAPCGWSGVGTYNASGQHLVFISGAFTTGLIVHELGHGLGLQHSGALDCDRSPLGDTCSINAYGDVADTMGNQAGHFNAFQKERLGWLNGAGAPPIATINSSGSYRIDTFETMGSGAKALKILKSTDPATGDNTWYYIEYRQPVGFDRDFGSYGNLTRGVQVRTATVVGGLGTSRLLDMTAGSDLSTPFADFEDGALGLAQTFTDTTAGVSIRLTAMDAAGATVEVGFASPPSATCTRAAPTFSLAGPGTSMTAGTTASYTVSVGNRDSAACAPTSFNLARTLPAGWTGTFAASSLSLAPGASASTILSVTSASSSPAGTYPVSANTVSSVGTSHAATASGSYAITAAGNSLTEGVASDKAAYLRGETAYLSARTLSSGVPVGGASVKFTVTLPGGGTVLFSATSGSDGYARSSYRIGKGKTALGSYTLRADASSAGASASATSGFAVK